MINKAKFQCCITVLHYILIFSIIFFMFFNVSELIEKSIGIIKIFLIVKAGIDLTLSEYEDGVIDIVLYIIWSLY